MWRNIYELQSYLRKTGVRFSSLLLPAGLAVVASGFEGLTLALLIPLMNSLVAGEIQFAFTLPIIGKIDLAPYAGLHYARALGLLVGAIFLFAVTKTMLVYFSSLTLSRQTRLFSAQMRSLIYERYLRFGKLYFDRTNAGHLNQVLIVCVSMLSNAVAAFNGALYAACALFVYLCIMAAISWQLTLCVLFIFPLLHYSLRWLIKRIAQTSTALAAMSSELAKKISNALGGMTLVHASGTESEESVRFKHLSEHVAALDYSIGKKSLLIGPIQEILLLCILFFLVVLIGVFFVKDGSHGFGTFAVYLLTMKRASSLFGVMNSIQATAATASGPLGDIRLVFSDEGKFIVPDGENSFPGLKKQIEFRHLSYTYPDGVHALKDVSFSVDRGEIVALVGQSGAGKSTLINLLMRFYDTSPETILVDGEDIRRLKIRTWRENISLVSQEPYLFHATLRENLLYGAPRDVSEDELMDILSRARLLDFIAGLPAGLEAQIGDRGVKLSGGEKQRVSIARALIKRAGILLLDEPTSALDSTTEKLIQEALGELVKDRTSIVIAHRLSTIRHANKIVVLENGRVMEEGTFDALRERRGRFHSYWQSQQT